MKDPNLIFEESLIIQFQKITKNNQENNFLNLLNTKKAQEIDIMQKIYIKNSLRYLNDELYESLHDDLKSILTLKMTIFICFNLIFLIIYFFLWIPLIEKMILEVK